MGLTQEQKDKLKALPKVKCAKCGKSRYYANPFAKCFECGKKFCFDHIFGSQIKKGMGKNEVVRDICEKCKEKFGYKRI